MLERADLEHGESQISPRADLEHGKSQISPRADLEHGESQNSPLQSQTVQTENLLGWLT